MVVDGFIRRKEEKKLKKIMESNPAEVPRMSMESINEDNILHLSNNNIKE